jgi:hypothetical protein
VSIHRDRKEPDEAHDGEGEDSEGHGNFDKAEGAQVFAEDPGRFHEYNVRAGRRMFNLEERMSFILFCGLKNGISLL